MNTNEQKLIQLLRGAKNPAALYAVADAAVAMARMDVRRSRNKKERARRSPRLPSLDRSAQDAVS